MAFFDELGKKISQTSQGVVQKTKDTAEVIKLNGMISDEEKRINNLYTQIEDLKQQIQHIKGVKVCNNCGAEIPENSMFCIGCGAKIVMQSEVNTNNFIRCVKCNR